MRELSQHILDALQNAREAKASAVDLVIEEDLAADRLTIVVQDNGRGIGRDHLRRIFDPFFTTRSTRRVGLGLPLFKAAAERCNGDLTIRSQAGEGTTLRATFQHSHIDRPPLGNITSTLMTVILAGGCDLHYVHRREGRTFEFRTADMRAELGDVPLTHPAVRGWLKDFVAQGEAALRES